MNWSLGVGMTVAVLLIFLVEWPKLRSQPRKDRYAFVLLLSIGWILSLFDLQNLPGPITFLEMVFRPFSAMMR